MLAGAAAGVAFPAAAAPQEFARRAAALAAQEIRFAPGESDVDDDQADVVVEHVHLVQDFPLDRIIVRAGCDGSEGRRDPGIALRRAQAVRRQLLLLGVQPGRVEAVAEPCAAETCTEGSCPAQDRRARILHALD